MKTVKVVVLALAALGALAALNGCTDESSRAILQVVNVNDGKVYYSDLVSDSGLVVADEVKITATSTPNAGTPALAPGTPFSQIILTDYTVAFDNGIYPPFSSGLTVIINSGEATTFTIALTDLGAKASLPTNIAVGTTARITIHGFNHLNGGNNGDRVTATASVPVQIANFKDSDVNQYQ